MKKKVAKVIAAVLAVCSVTTIFSGCKDSKETSGSDGMTIKWLGPPYYADSEEGGETQKLLEEKFGVKLEPVYMDSDAYNNTKPLQFANGDIPDLIYEMDPTNVQGDAKQGFLAEVPYETIAKYAPNVFKNLTENIPAIWLYSLYNEKNYGVPNLFYSGDYPTLGLWRKDWLKNVGIDKVPETIDEMHDALYKFTYNDPDGNGKNDTYGMTGNLKYSFQVFPEIFGAYGALPFDWVERDGKIVYGGLQPEVSAALETLSKWYDEGIIDPDFITDDVDGTMKNKFQNGKTGYTNNWGHLIQTYDESAKDSLVNVMKQINKKAEIATAPLPKGPGGKSGKFVWSKAGHIVCFGRQLEKEPEKLRKILEMLEYMYTDQDFAVQMKMGKENVAYKFNEEKGGIDYIEPYNDSTYRGKQLGSSGIDGTSFWDVMPVLPETQEKFMSTRDKELLEFRKTQNGMPDVFLKPDTVPGSDKYFEDIKNKQMVLMAEIITGEKPVSEYEKFADEYKSLGGDKLRENAAKLGTSLNKITDTCKSLVK